MNREKFATEMTKTAIATRSDIDEVTMMVYWEHFKDWKESDFVMAMEGCRSQAGGFPSVGRIIETGARIEAQIRHKKRNANEYQEKQKFENEKAHADREQKKLIAKYGREWESMTNEEKMELASHLLDAATLRLIGARTYLLRELVFAEADRQGIISLTNQTQSAAG